MSAPALDYSYRYAFRSDILTSAGRPNLRLATFGGEVAHPYFFEGRLVRPHRTASLLRGLMQVVHARFHVLPAMLQRILAMADPVVTSSEQRLRFEGFSGCASAYARLDLLPSAVEGETLERGTTNVDFNAPLLTALARIRDTDEVALSVGAREVKLDRNNESIVERKVSLPVRWLKGFVEVQSYQARMQLVHDISGIEALRFLRSLPRAKTRNPCWVVPAGQGLRLSQQPTAIGVQVNGLECVRVLEGLAPLANRLCVHGDPATGTSAWMLELDEARFHLVLSPDVWRGFSGEGQALTALARNDCQVVLPQVRAALKWDAIIDVANLAAKTCLLDEEVRIALAALGARGLVGFDLAAGAYFHRELPFDLSLVETLQPRLKSARKLLEAGKVRIHVVADEQVELFVAGSDVEHRVRVAPTGSRCTCAWFSKHQGQRGPCKHVLAAQLFLDREQP